MKKRKLKDFNDDEPDKADKEIDILIQENLEIVGVKLIRLPFW